MKTIYRSGKSNVVRKKKKKIAALLFLSLICFLSSLQAQDLKYTNSPWWIGSAGGINFNLYHGSIQSFNSGLSHSAEFSNQIGQGLFAFPFIEFHRPDKNWGFMIYTGYESRRGSFDESYASKLAYITVEPSIRLDLFNSPLYFYTGPRFAFNSDKRFSYLPGTDLPESVGTMSDMKKSVISMQIGFGYDVSLSSKDNKTQVILAPFAAFHPYFGQNPRTIESWNLTTIRGGISIKFGRGKKTSLPEKIFVPAVIRPETSPSDLITEPEKAKTSVSEMSTVYFDLKPSGIDDPFSKSGKFQLKNFGSNDLAEDTLKADVVPEDNFLDRLGRQMKKEPMSRITLIGSPKKNDRAGLQLAESVKLFLAGVYGIDRSRIEVKDRSNLKIHKKQSGEKYELAVIRQSDRQLLVRTNSKALATGFRNPENSAVSTIKIYDVPLVNKEGQIILSTKGSAREFASWSANLVNDQGKERDLGPFSREQVNLPTKDILEEKPAGKYDISMIGQLDSGQILRKDTSVFLSAWPILIMDKVMRFSIQYEFNHSKSAGIYAQYLANVVAPNIPSGARVIIHGHSESINYGDFDLKSYLSRLNDARSIIESSLKKAQRDDVEFQVFDFSPDPLIAPFLAKNQEAEFSSRTVIIDVILP